MSAAPVAPTAARIDELTAALGMLQLPRDRVAYKQIQAELRFLKTEQRALHQPPPQRRLPEIEAPVPPPVASPPPPMVAPVPEAQPKPRLPAVGISFINVTTPPAPPAPVAPPVVTPLLAPVAPPVASLPTAAGPTVFLSHSSVDVAFLDGELIPQLTARGLRTWSSNRDIPPGTSWNDGLSQGLERCDWFLVVLSPDAVASRWVRREVQWAFMYRDEERILPVLFRECGWKSLHWVLDQVQHLNYLRDPAAARQQLLARLTGQPHGGGQP